MFRLKTISSVAFVLMATAFAQFAAADTVLMQDNFDGQTLGTLLNSTTSPPIGLAYGGSGDTVTWATVMDTTTTPPGNAASGTQFVGRADTGDKDWGMNFDPATVPGITQVDYKFSLYMVGGSAATDGFQVVGATSFDALATGAQTFNLKMYPDGSGWWYGHTGSNPNESHPIAAGTFARDAWVPVDLAVDYSTHTYGLTVGSAATINGGFRDNTAGFGHLYFGVDGGATAFVDSVSITTPTTVPEPCVLTLLAMGLIGLLAYAWRKRK